MMPWNMDSGPLTLRHDAAPSNIERFKQPAEALQTRSFGFQGYPERYMFSPKRPMRNQPSADNHNADVNRYFRKEPDNSGPNQGPPSPGPGPKNEAPSWLQDSHREPGPAQAPKGTISPRYHENNSYRQRTPVVRDPLRELTSAEKRKKIDEHYRAQEDLAEAKARRHDRDREQMEEKLRVRKMIDSYNPFGKPGAGAPNRVYIREMQEEYNPYGMPGGGAPRGDNRKMKFTEHQMTKPESPAYGDSRPFDPVQTDRGSPDRHFRDRDRRIDAVKENMDRMKNGDYTDRSNVVDMLSENEREINNLKHNLAEIERDRYAKNDLDQRQSDLILSQERKLRDMGDELRKLKSHAHDHYHPEMRAQSDKYQHKKNLHSSLFGTLNPTGPNGFLFPESEKNCKTKIPTPYASYGGDQPENPRDVDEFEKNRRRNVSTPLPVFEIINRRGCSYGRNDIKMSKRSDTFKSQSSPTIHCIGGKSQESCTLENSRKRQSQPTLESGPQSHSTIECTRKAENTCLSKTVSEVEGLNWKSATKHDTVSEYPLPNLECCVDKERSRSDKKDKYAPYLSTETAKDTTQAEKICSMNEERPGRDRKRILSSPFPVFQCIQRSAEFDIEEDSKTGNNMKVEFRDPLSFQDGYGGDDYEPLTDRPMRKSNRDRDFWGSSNGGPQDYLGVSPRQPMGKWYSKESIYKKDFDRPEQRHGTKNLKNPNWDHFEPFDPFGAQGGGAPLYDNGGQRNTKIRGTMRYIGREGVESAKAKRAQKMDLHETYERQLEEDRMKKQQEKMMNRAGFTDFAVKMRDMSIGKLNYDSNGMIGNHHLPHKMSSVVTERPGESEKKSYYNELKEQVEHKTAMERIGKLEDKNQANAHFHNFDNYFGNPGGGARKGNNLKKLKLNDSIYNTHESPSYYHKVRLDDDETPEDLLDRFKPRITINSTHKNLYEFPDGSLKTNYRGLAPYAAEFQDGHH